jgi:ABC-type multidrug transport system fused ATPase/permease subunit
MRKIAAVFQDYKLFAFSIDENITCKEKDIDVDRTMEIIEDVGLKNKVDSLPNGISSLFGKAYDESGIEMSGGESQKIAIARALYKDASLIILDEPTSALDPLAEADIYENFNRMVGGKTAIYISHRMSSSVFCDKILIIEDGRVADYDSHTNLLEKKESLYYKLFNSQAVNYAID